MSSSLVNTEPCVRCGNRTRIKESSTNFDIKYIEVCIQCGHENYILAKLHSSTSLFRELRLKNYRLGLRKYRNNNEEESFKGSPYDVAQKNLAALANCITIIGANKKEESNEYLEKMMIAIESMFYHIEHLKTEAEKNKNHYRNGMKAKTEEIF